MRRGEQQIKAKEQSRFSGGKADRTEDGGGAEQVQWGVECAYTIGVRMGGRAGTTEREEKQRKRKSTGRHQPPSPVLQVTWECTITFFPPVLLPSGTQLALPETHEERGEVAVIPESALFNVTTVPGSGCVGQTDDTKGGVQSMGRKLLSHPWKGAGWPALEVASTNQGRKPQSSSLPLQPSHDMQQGSV